MKPAVILSLFLTLSIPAIAQTPASPDHIREFMEASGSAKLGIQVMNSMIEAYKKQMPSVPTEFWDEFEKEIDPNDLVNLMIPIYSKYFTDEDILQLIQFYKSPIGVKFTTNLPMITQDSFAAGSEWGKKIGAKVVSKLKEKGYIKNG